MKKFEIEYDVIVVGGGPAGCVAARFAAEGGAKTLLLEKDKEIGIPVRCGEAISKEGVEEFIVPNLKWIRAKINKFIFTSPDSTTVEMPLSEEAGYVLDRKIFDNELARLASEAGADVITKSYVDELILEDGIVKGVGIRYLGSKYYVKSKIVIAADGVESRAGRWAGLETACDFRDMESCVQVVATNVNIDQNALYFYLGEKTAPTGYLWIFPKGDNTANIGLGIGGKENKKKSAKRYLDEFLQKNFPNASILNFTVGGVPCCPTLKKIVAPGIILVGDAARQVNPLSGGGIASGMIGGKLAGITSAKSIKKNDLNIIYEYEQLWRTRLGNRHEIFNRLKEGIYNFTDDHFNSIARDFLNIKYEERNLYKLFMIALKNKPTLFVDIAKAFLRI